MRVSLVLCGGYYKPISRIGVNVSQWKVITLAGCLLVQACLKAVSLGPFFLLSKLMTYHHLFHSLLYADDTKLSTPVSSPSDCSLLQFDIQALERWSSHSGLSFNASKSFLLRFCNRSPLASVDYSLKDFVISCVSSCRDLGVIFSSNLSWTEHYKVVSRNAYNQLYVIKRSFSVFCPPPIKRLLYISLVRSKLSYCSQVWRPMLI